MKLDPNRCESCYGAETKTIKYAAFRHFLQRFNKRSKDILLTIIFPRYVKKLRFLTTREIILHLSVLDVVIPVSKSEKHTDKKGGH